MFKFLNFSILTILCACGLSAASYNMKTIGAPGNKPDIRVNRRGRGEVNYYYRIADAPVSNADYAEFLNSTNKSGKADTYDSRMTIKRTGSSGNYTYSANKTAAVKPVTYVSYANAAEYCNWRSKAKVYDVIDEQVTIRKISRSDSPEIFFIPSHDEWYKGRFYKNGRYDYGSPLKVAEMVETRHSVWFRIAVGHDANPEKFIKVNHYTSCNSGKSEDNIRLGNVGFRVASMSTVYACPDLNNKNNLFYTDRPEVQLKLRSAVKCTVNLKAVVKDYWGKTVKELSKKLNLTAGSKVISLASDIKDTGHYTVVVTMEQGKEEIQRQTIPFVLMDKKNSVKRSSKSPYGFSAHFDRMINCWGRMYPKDYMHILKASNASWLRTDMPFDYSCKPFIKEGFHILSFILPFHTNYKKFASAFKETELSRKWEKYGVPKELSVYAEECYKMVKKYPRIKSWEIGNEPHGWKMSPWDYAQMCKTAYKAAKLADPSVTIVIGDSEHIHQSIIGEGYAADFCDAVATHNYGFFKDYYEGVIGRLYRLQDQLALKGQKDKPIWLTETSGCGYWNHIYPGLTEAERYTYQALDMPKKLAGSVALGVSKVFIYEFMDTVVKGTESEFGVIRSDFLPKPAFMSYRTTVAMVADKKCTGKIDLDKKFTGFVFSNQDKRVALMWKEDKPATLERRKRIDVPMVKISSPENLAFRAKGEVNLVDIMGRRTKLEVNNGKVNVPVNEFPVFVEGDVEYKLSVPRKLPEVEKEKPEAKIQILPPLSQMTGPNDLHNMQHVVRIKLTRRKPQSLDVRVHNLTSKELTGEVYLVPPTSNSDGGWEVKPTSKKVTIPADGAATVKFNILIGKRPYTGESPYILTGIFKTDKIKYHHNVIVYQVHNNEVKLKSFMKEDKTFILASGKNRQYMVKPSGYYKTKYTEAYEKKDVYEVNITKGRKFIEIFAERKPVVDMSAPLDGAVTFQLYQVPGLKINKVNFRLTDSQGEVFQYEKRGFAPVNQWVTFTYDLSKEKYRGHWGENANNKIDFPVKWRSIVIDYQGPSGTFYVTRLKYLKD